MSMEAHENPEMWSALIGERMDESVPSGSCSSHCHGAEQRQQVQYAEPNFAEALTPA